MPRVPQVTRTIQSTLCTVLCLDIETAEPFTTDVRLTRTYKDERKMLDKVKAVIESDTVKAVTIQSFKVEETLYGMDEQKFIELATILPPRGASPGTAEEAGEGAK